MLVRPRGPIGGNGPLDNPTTGDYKGGAVNLTQTTLLKDATQKISNIVQAYNPKPDPGFRYQYLNEDDDPEQYSMVFTSGSVYLNGYIWLVSLGTGGGTQQTKIMGWNAITKQPHPNSPIYLKIGGVTGLYSARQMISDGKNLWIVSPSQSGYHGYLWKIDPDTNTQMFYDLTSHPENACVRGFQVWQYGNVGLNLNGDAVTVTVNVSGDLFPINMVGAGGGVDPVSVDNAIAWINANKGTPRFEARKNTDPSTGESHVMLIAENSEASIDTTLPGGYTMLATWHGVHGYGFRGIAFDPKHRNLWIMNPVGNGNTGLHGRAVPFVWNIDTETCVSHMEDLYCVYDTRTSRQFTVAGKQVVCDLNDGQGLVIFDTDLIKSIGTVSTGTGANSGDLIYDGRHVYGNFYKYDPETTSIVGTIPPPPGYSVPSQMFCKVIVTDDVVVQCPGWNLTYNVFSKRTLKQIDSGAFPFKPAVTHLWGFYTNYANGYPSDGKTTWINPDTTDQGISDLQQVTFPILVTDVQDYTGVLSSPQKLTVEQSGAVIGVRTALNFIFGENLEVSVTDNGGSGRVDVSISNPPSRFNGEKYPLVNPLLVVDPGAAVTASKMPFDVGPGYPDSRIIYPTDADTPLGLAFFTEYGRQYNAAPVDGIVKALGAGPNDRIVSYQGSTKFTSPPQMTVLSPGRAYYAAASNRDPTVLVRIIPNRMEIGAVGSWSTSKRMLRIQTGDVWYFRSEDDNSFHADVSTDGGYTFPTSFVILATSHGGGTYVTDNYKFDSYYCLACLTTSGGRIILAGGQEYDIGSDYAGVRSIYSDDNGTTWGGHTYVIPITTNLSAPLLSGATTVVVNDSSIFPVVGFPYNFRIGFGTANQEDVIVTANDGVSTLTLSVGTVNAHSSGEIVGILSGIRAADLVEAGNGDILCVSYAAPTSSKIYVSKSTDNGYSWIFPPVTITSPGIAYGVRAIRCNNGTNDILVYWYVGSDVYTSRSIDNGATFSAPAILSNTRGVDVLPFIYKHEDSSLYLFTRRIGSDQMLYRVSTDHGVTWTEPKWLSENLFGNESYFMDMLLMGTSGKVLGSFGNAAGNHIGGTTHACMNRGEITDVVPSWSGYYRQQIGLATDPDTLCLNIQEPTLVKADILSPPYTGETIAPALLQGNGQLNLSTDDLVGTSWDSSNPKTQYFELVRTVGGMDPLMVIQFKYRLSADLCRSQQYSTTRDPGNTWQMERLFNSLKIRAGRSLANANNKVSVTLFDTKGNVNPAINNKDLTFTTAGSYEEFTITPTPNGVYNESPFVAPVLGGSFEAGGEITVRLILQCDANVGTDYVRVSDITLDIG